MHDRRSCRDRPHHRFPPIEDLLDDFLLLERCRGYWCSLGRSPPCFGHTRSLVLQYGELHSH